MRWIILVLLMGLPGLNASAEIMDPDGQIQPHLLGKALAALETHAAASRSPRLVIVDYSRRSSEPRLHILDLQSGSVESYRTAHGRGSDPDHDGYLDTFSDVPGSSASPQGAYRTAEEYTGRHGRSLRLDGLDETNANARDRAIVIHAAEYVEPDWLKRHGKLGRSNGCIVLSQADLVRFLADIPRGTLIFVGR